jgi:hypothetical protein
MPHCSHSPTKVPRPILRLLIAQSVRPVASSARPVAGVVRVGHACDRCVRSPKGRHGGNVGLDSEYRELFKAAHFKAAPVALQVQVLPRCKWPQPH